MPKVIYGSVLDKNRRELVELCCKSTDFDNSAFVYLVPTVQLKKEIEKSLTNIFSSEKKGFLGNLNVYLFNEFVHQLLKSWGVYRKPLSNTEQKMILKKISEELIAQEELTYLKDMVNFDGFYSGVQQWLAGIKARGETPVSYLKKYSTSNTKERELGRIFEKYEECLEKNDLIDEINAFVKVITHLKNGDVTEGVLHRIKLIVIDGFYRLDDIQLRLVKTLINKGKEVIIHTFGDKKRDNLSNTFDDLITQMTDEQDFNWEVEYWGEIFADFIPPALKHIQDSLFNLSAPKIACDDSVRIYYTHNRYDEIMQIGREIRLALLKNPQLKFNEIGVILKNIEDYRLYIDQIFNELQIPFTISEGIKLIRMPVFKVILHLYNIFNTDWSREALMTFFKSRYLNLADEKDMPIFEDLIKEAGIIKGHREWIFKLQRYQKILLKQCDTSDTVKEKINKITLLINILNKLLPQLQELQKSQSLLEHTEKLLTFLNEYQLVEKIMEADDMQIISRDFLCVKSLQQIIQDLIHLSSLLLVERKKISYSDFIKLLIQKAEEVKITEESDSSSVVQILTPSKSRGMGFKLCFIGGLEEGIFPSYKQKDWLVGKKLLKDQGIARLEVSEELKEERLFFLKALSTAREKLILSVPVSKDGGQCSSFIYEIINLFQKGTIEEKEIVNHLESESVLLTKKDLQNKLLQMVWDNPEKKKSLKAARVWDTELELLFRRGETIRLREAGEFTEFDGYLKDEIIIGKLKERFSYERVYSISQLNEYAFCPFHFFMNRVLHLDEVSFPINRLEVLDLGNLYHKILYLFFKDFPGWKEESFENALDRINKVAREVLDNYLPGLNLLEGLWNIYREEILKNLKRLIDFEYRAAMKQEFEMKPFLMEMSFGLQENLREEGNHNFCTPVVIEKENDDDKCIRVSLNGKIDRVDISNDGKYVIIYDYKLGQRDGLLAIERGLDLQLPIYIKAIEQISGEEKIVLGAGYFSIYHCNRENGIWRDLRPDLIPLKSSKKCLGDEDWNSLMEKVDNYIFSYIERIREGDFRVIPASDCPQYCQYKKICRFERSRINGKLKGLA